MDRIKFNMPTSDFIKSVGTTIIPNGGRPFHYIPFWFEETENPEEFIQHSFEKLPLYLKQKILKMRTGGILPKVKSTYKFPNGMVVTFDMSGEQIPELQGVYSEELHELLRQSSDENTEWNGF